MDNGSTYPTYFCADFLKSVLEEGFNRTDVKVLNYDIKKPSLGGDNYSSNVYRVKVDYEFVCEEEKPTKPLEISLILKDMRCDVEESMTVKSKETAMYERVVPEMEAILGGKKKLAPKLFTARKYDSEVFVFEDLNAIGYELKDRVSGLNEEDCIALLKNIGIFHATSMVFAEKHPDIIDKIKDHQFQFGTKISPLMYTHMIGMIRSAAETVEAWEGFDSIAHKLYKLSTVFHEKSMESVNRPDCRYKVVNHGDLWVNNFLFKGNDIAFIDLQLSSYGSPASDINYFLYTSVPLELLKTKRYELLRIYFKQFQDTLKSLDFEKPPSWEDFVYEMRQLEFAGVWALFAILPLISLDKESSKGTDMETFKNEEAFAAKKKLMFGSKRMQETLKYAVDRFNEVGVFDFN